jgi:hypothetical protein
MRTLLTTMIETIKIFILFVGFTLLFYYGILWLNEEYEGHHRYDQPHGGAVKVMSVIRQNDSKDSFFQRLYYFYQHGE